MSTTEREDGAAPGDLDEAEPQDLAIEEEHGDRAPPKELYR